jgi:GNAT superfamily N-acetyltransferase
MPEQLHHRLAVQADAPALKELMAAAMAENLKPFLPPDLIATSYAVMGLETTLIADRTYWAIHAGHDLIGCGGWSRRATLYDGDLSAGRSAALLDPAVNTARVRAMCTHPAWVPRGVGSLILRLSEAAAANEGFSRLELMATLSGEPLYRARGFTALERIEDGGVPLMRMTKRIAATTSPASSAR